MVGKKRQRVKNYKSETKERKRKRTKTTKRENRPKEALTDCGREKEKES